MTLHAFAGRLAAAATIPALLAVGTAQAGADGPLQVTSASCFETVGAGYYGGSYHTPQIECDFSWSGGSGAVTPSYSATDAGIFYSDAGGVVDAYCNVGSRPAVTVTVADSLGATASGTGRTECTSEAP